MGNIIVHDAEECYKRIAKQIIFDKDIDVVTLGVFVRIASCSKEWKLNVEGLARALNLSTNKTRECIVLLEKKGYLKRVPVKQENGRFKGWDYEVYNMPLDEKERSSAGKSTDFEVLDKSENGQVQKLEDYNIETIKEDKTINKEKPKTEVVEFPYGERAKSLYNELMAYPEWKKKSAHAKELRLKNLIRIAGTNEMKAIACIKQTMSKCWLDFYEPSREYYEMQEEKPKYKVVTDLF